jgi:hypothetical protein
MHLHLDPVAGLAGDMWLGLLADLGLEERFFTGLPKRLGLDGVEVTVERVRRGVLAARKVRVRVRGHEEGPSPSLEETAPPAAGETAPHGPHRRLADMLALLAAAGLPPRAERRARTAFEALFAAEAAVHGQALEEVHLHEAGADDAVVDIAGTCLGLEQLGVTSVSCSVPIPLGGGTIRCAHGVLPVPAPAVVALLAGVEVRGGPIERELVTPTGAALLRAVADTFGAAPAMMIGRPGTGAGTRDDPELPNVLRGILGDAHAGPRESEVAVIETAIDDALPQDLAVLAERLRDAGALDVMVQPAAMKKGRAGQLLTVVARAGDERELASRILHESPTLGVRCRREKRYEWDRDVVTVDTPWGPVRVKRAKDGGGRVLRGQPEFEDCRAIADREHVPVSRVRDAARDAFDRRPPGRNESLGGE